MFYYFLYTYLTVLTLSMGVGLYYHKYLRGPFRFLIIALCLAWVVEMIGLYHMLSLKRNNLLLFQIYAPLEYIFMGAYFYHTLRKERLRKAVLVSVVGYVLFCIVNIGVLLSLRPNNSYSFMLLAILLAFWAASYFYESYQNETLYGEIWRDPHIWICTGVLFYYAGTFFLMALIQQLAQSNLELASRLYVINHILNIVLYSMFTVGFICKVRAKKSPLL
ncbi:hypothetical protein GCM10027275_20790 [Rhabdobacter roseus]|uniref:Histidine kinase N-terminal 7TM region domain-containing protein n=1 Tax=Rhabdobacter roseus TaxID=1655419 RepID=A0A840TR46_9BACT|nr:hypothetical protein [Rhabdobacter roseus]MBB5284012.1 hypothetical protein [Rhabdobacter roseus]